MKILILLLLLFNPEISYSENSLPQKLLDTYGITNLNTFSEDSYKSLISNINGVREDNSAFELISNNKELFMDIANNKTKNNNDLKNKLYNIINKSLTHSEMLQSIDLYNIILKDKKTNEDMNALENYHKNGMLIKSRNVSNEILNELVIIAYDIYDSFIEKIKPEASRMGFEIINEDGIYKFIRI